jgi:hypothetical protein
LTTMAMAQRDTTTMTTSMDDYDKFDKNRSRQQRHCQ